MNLAANQLTCLFCNTKLLAPIDVSGEFDKDIITVMKTRVHPRDRVVFRNFFTAETILRKLDAGEELSVEYRKLGLDGTYHWMLALIVPLPTGNRGETVLLVRDVTEKKEEENNYLLALQNNYSEVFSLDVRSRTVTPLFYNSEQVPIVKEEANFSAFVKRRAVDRVAPESLESVLDFYERRLSGNWNAAAARNVNTASVRRKTALTAGSRPRRSLSPATRGTPLSCCATSPRRKKRKTTTSSPCKATIRKFSASILKPGLSLPSITTANKSPFRRP